VRSRSRPDPEPVRAEAALEAQRESVVERGERHREEEAEAEPHRHQLTLQLLRRPPRGRAIEVVRGGDAEPAGARERPAEGGRRSFAVDDRGAQRAIGRLDEHSGQGPGRGIAIDDAARRIGRPFAHSRPRERDGVGPDGVPVDGVEDEGTVGRQPVEHRARAALPPPFPGHPPSH
jgi:hypothetical protein